MRLRISRTTPRTRRTPLRFEELECRTVPTYFNPAQIRHAYGFDQISFLGNYDATAGAGQTIAIVDAYDDPNIASDLHHFNTSGDFGFTLPDSTFTKIDQNGGTNYPAVDAGWSGEIALDVEWAHAIAPAANILLVEANSASFNDLLKAVDTAANYPGVSVVSMSWGASEFFGESSYDFHFSHPGVTFVASSGDSGTPPSWPAISSNVLSVGGTSLSLNSDSTWRSETGWRFSGGGTSRFVSKPDYQTNVTTPSSTKRTNPDVAYNADPNTGVLVYDSVNGGWFAFGGTSAGAPQWSALVAIGNQGRGAAGSLDGATQTLYAIYKAAKADYASTSVSEFHDITSGSNGGGSRAGAKYDTVTGVGSPMANQVVAALVAWTGTGNANGSFVGGTNPQTPPAGGAIRHAIISTVTVTSTAPATTLASTPSGNDTRSAPVSTGFLPAGAPAPTFFGAPVDFSTAGSAPAASTSRATGSISPTSVPFTFNFRATESQLGSFDRSPIFGEGTGGAGNGFWDEYFDQIRPIVVDDDSLATSDSTEGSEADCSSGDC